MSLFKFPINGEISRKLFTYALILGIIAFSIVLLGYAYIGLFSRYWADDYCFSALAKNYGVWGGLKEHYITWSNRYTAYFLSVKWDWLGVINVQLYPAVMIFALVAGLTLNVRLLLRKFQMPDVMLISILLGEITAFFILYEAPNLFQSLYWRSGMVSYFAPLVLWVFLNAIVIFRLDDLKNKKLNWLWSFLEITLAFFVMGTSETFATLFCGYLILLGLFLWRSHHTFLKLPHFFFNLLGATVIGGLIILLSPGNQVRMQYLNPVKDIFIFLQMTIHNAGVVLFQSLIGALIPSTILFLIGFLLFRYLAVRFDLYVNTKRIPIFILALFSGAGFLLACLCAPTVYSMMAFPEPRALILGRMVVIVLTIALGSLIGIFSKNIFKHTIESDLIFTLIFLCLVTIYPLRAAQKTYNEIPIVQKRAEIWDLRKIVIEEAIDNGQDHLDLTPVNSVNGISELSEQPEFWVNSCAADFFGIGSLRAVDRP